MARKTTAERFWQKVNRQGPIPTEGTAEGPCWLWTGAKTSRGYGNFWTGSGHASAHRWLYEHTNGPVSPELHLDHLCRNRACCNPAHLEPVTPRVNVLRGISPIADNARKQLCDHGHPLSGPNARVADNGTRTCRTCDRNQHNSRYANDAEYRERKRAYQRAYRARLLAEKNSTTTREAA